MRRIEETKANALSVLGEKGEVRARGLYRGTQRVGRTPGHVSKHEGLAIAPTECGRSGWDLERVRALTVDRIQGENVLQEPPDVLS